MLPDFRQYNADNWEQNEPMTEKQVVRQLNAERAWLKHYNARQPAEMDLADSLMWIIRALRPAYEFGAGQPRGARAVIARFGRHPHRNGVLGRDSTPEELDYIATGNFPHTTKLGVPSKGA